MLTTSPLIELNKQLVLKNGIFQNKDKRFRDTKLSNYIQIAVTDTLNKVDNMSLTSIQIEQALDTNELRDALSTTHFRLLEALNLDGIHNVLEISEDFGGVAHYVSDKVGAIDSIKLDPDLARISARRCANKHNVSHISEDLSKLSFPKGHYDLILMPQLELLEHPLSDLDSLLSALNQSLTANGVILISAPNANRLGKLLNRGKSDLPYEDSYKTNKYSDTLLEVKRRDFRQKLMSHNFSSVDFHASFSSDDSCRNLFSEDYLTSSVNSLNHFYRLGAIDNNEFCEYLLFKRLVEEKHDLVDFASRFLIIAGRSTERVRKLYDNDFSYFAGTGRKPEFRTITSRKRAAQNVEKTPLHPELTSDSDLIGQNLAPQPFFKGPLLVDKWLDALLENDHLALQKLISSYHKWLLAYSEQHALADAAYDLLPFNLVINERSGEYQPIDVEWQLKQEITVDFIFYRALYWFAFENKTLLKRYAAGNNIYSIATFILKHMPNAHKIGDLDEFTELEERIQAEIDNNFRANSVSQALLQPFDSKETSEAPVTLQLVWGDQNQKMKLEDAKLIDWERSSESQTIKAKLPQPDSDYPILRIDPLAEAASFKVGQLRLVDSDGKKLWAGTVDDAISSQGLVKNKEAWLSINSDPFWLFDFGKNPKISNASDLEIELSWVWGAEYSQALNALNELVASLHESASIQTQRLNEYQAELDFKTLRIEDLLGNRNDLNRMVSLAEKRVARERQHQGQLNNQITHLEARLHAQHVRNDELHGYLLMRPTTRIKRVAKRWINRILKRSDEAIAETPEVVEEVNNTPASPLPAGELLGQNTEDYGLWVSENSMTDADIEAAKIEIEEMAIKPVFSILVPIYNTDPEYLLPMIESVRKQIYPYWQLCLVDDSSPKTYLKRILEHEALQDERISIQLNDINQGISVTTNDALAMATGDYIALLDHDDEITIDALYENAKVINQDPDVGLIYSDEDKMDMQGGRLEPFFKPDYSPDLLDTNNYVCHFTVIKKSIMDEIGGFREGLDGSQDHDVILRAADQAKSIVHIPKILYHWRKIPGSTAVVYDSKSYAWEAGRKAVEDIRRKHEDNIRVEFGTLKGTYRVYREIIGKPLVSIVIPFKDKPELLDSCLNSILNRTSYTNFEVIGVSNNSEESLTKQRMDFFTSADERIKFVEHNVPFNFSAICNYGVTQAQGEYIVLLNNDIEIITPDWIERMLEHAQRPQIGAVGCKLLYPNGLIQHAGIVAGMVGAAGHPHKFFPDNHIGYHGRLHMVYNVSAVTGAMMMMAKSKFEEVGGLDEKNLAVAYNDVDLCLKLLDKGYYNLFTPHAKATHHESISRGYEDTDEKMQRLLKEQKHFLSTWADFLEKGDPFYNPNLSLKNERFSLKFKD